MRLNKKLGLIGFILICSISTQIMAERPTLQTMMIKLSNLEVDITKEKFALIKRETALNELKVRALQSNKVDKKNMALKLAEIEASLVKDRLLLSKREVKLFEMKVALVKEKNKQ